MKTKLMFALSVVFLLLGQVFALTLSSGDVKLGEWNRRTTAARAYAEKNNIPLLLFRVNNGCSKCRKLEGACAEESFLTWQKNRQLVMVVSSNIDPATEYNAGRELTPQSVIASSSMPKIAVYWKKADGTILHKGFVGRSGQMLGQDRSLPLEEQMMNAVDSILRDYRPVPPYKGGKFAVTESSGHRYEVEANTQSVSVGVVRDASVKGSAASNRLIAYRPDGTSFWTKDLSWAVNEVQKTVTVDIPGGALTANNQKIKLILLDANGESKDTNTITCVTMGNSVKNPRWIGEAFNPGEWTMDLAAATNKSAYTLVAVTGALWCPDCKNTDNNFLNVKDAAGKNRFAQWAVQRGINLVTVDVPNFKGESHVAESPSLLSRTPYTTSFGVQSGLGYLTRKGVSDADALKVLKRNHQLVAKSSSTSILRRPEDTNSYRTGVPIFVLLRGDGTVAARLTYFASKSPVAEDQTQWANIIKRFDEMIEIAQRGGSHFDDIDNNHFSTTKESLTADGGSVSGEISHADFMDVYKLAGTTGGVLQKIEVTGSSSATVKVEIFNDANTFSNAASGKLSAGVSLERELPNGNYFVKVSGADIAGGDFSVKNAKANNFFAYSARASLVLVPREQAATATASPNSSEVLMRLTAGTQYRITGLAATQVSGGLEVVSGQPNIYRANKATGTYRLALRQPGGEITYQIWKPGSIGFTTTEQRFLEMNKTGSIKVARTGGSSGVATVKVSLTKNLTTAGRLEAPAASSELTWRDGESGEKTIAFSVKADSVYQEPDTFVLTIGAGGTCSATINAAAKTHTVTVIDSDKPILDRVLYTGIRYFPNFEVNQSYPVNNILEDGRVTIKKVSGKLPTGIRVKYDKATKSVVFSGKARMTGRYEYVFTITERRDAGSATGLETKFVIDVVDPGELAETDADYNAAVGNAMSLDLPIYAKVGDQRVLAGLLDLSVSRLNRISARFKGASSRTFSFSGYWQTLVNGEVGAVLKTRAGQELVLRLSREGLLFAAISNADTDFGSALTSPEGGVSAFAEGGFEPYSGYYTVTLPVVTDGLTAGRETIPTGTGYMTLKMNASSFTRTGRVSYSGKYADGTSFSGSTYLLPNAYADGSAQLCIFKRSTRNTIGLVLKVAPNAAENYEENPMGVLADEEVLPYWRSSSFGLIPLNVYGGYYDTKMDLLSCCAADYNTEKFEFACDLDYFAPSETYGNIVGMPQANVIVSSSAFDVDQLNDLKLTIKLMKRTGLVSGRFPVRFSNGKTITVMFYGVLLPHWYDCGCGDGAPVVLENRPFFSGFARYTDIVNGQRVKRSFAVDFNPIIESEE